MAKACETKVIRTAVKAPLMNAYAEQLVPSVKSSCLAQIIPLGERHLRKAV